MTLRERSVEETTEQYIARRAQDIHMEEAEIADPFISEEERAFRSAKAIGLLTSLVDEES